jgi:hypothetical protein
MHGRDEKWTQYSVGKPETMRHLEDLGFDGKVK